MKKSWVNVLEENGIKVEFVRNETGNFYLIEKGKMYLDGTFESIESDELAKELRLLGFLDLDRKFDKTHFNRSVVYKGKEVEDLRALFDIFGELYVTNLLDELLNVWQGDLPFTWEENGIKVTFTAI